MTEVTTLDRVIIRFAGDSGDGMQLTGDRFTQETATARQRPLDPAQLPGRDPRAPGHAAGRLDLPGALRRPRHPHPRRPPDVLVAMNPAALKANLGDLPARRG